ncbi:MAG: hypothetical protein CMJ23_03150 [Phycisphaerae bacterium]|nr:hypothetical protein [Phycisphaerae bacterium]
MAFAGHSAGAHGDGACNHDFNIPTRINSSICGDDSGQNVGSWSDAGGNFVRTHATNPNRLRSPASAISTGVSRSMRPTSGSAARRSGVTGNHAR